VITPDPDDLGVRQQLASLPDSFAHLEDVAKHDDLVDMRALQLVQGRTQKFYVFVDVSEESEFHVGSRRKLS